MKYTTYRNIKSILNHYRWFEYNGKIKEEDLLKICNCRNVEDAYEIIPKEDIAIAEECLNGTELTQIMRDSFSKMNSEEIVTCVNEYLTSSSYHDLANSFPDTSLLLEVLSSNLKDGSLIQSDVEAFLSCIPLNRLYQYVNNNGKEKNFVLHFLAKEFSDWGNVDFREIDSDIDKTKLILYSNEYSYELVLPFIEDLYCRNQLVKAQSDLDFDVEDLIEEIEIYEQHLNKLSQINNEKQKAEYIASIANNEIKQSLLETLSDQESRRIVIDSLQRSVDPEIADLDELARTMITEFFEDKLGNNFSEEKKERLQSTFNRTSVAFGELDTNLKGLANHILKTITISDRHKNNHNKNIGFLIHEYGHMLSAYYYSFIGILPEHNTEEGMADTFAELVVNHYLSKHKDIYLSGKKIRIDNPYITYSNYDRENSWVRTMLAGLENKGRDCLAIAEYILGDKNKYAEMVLGKQFAENEDVKKFDMLSMEDLYNSPKLDYSRINKDSLYYRRNNILPIFEMQNHIASQEGLLWAIDNSDGCFVEDVLEQYFNGKSFYEVPEDELEYFIYLLNRQKTSIDAYTPITQKNGIVDNLTIQEIQQHSYEILLRLPIIYGKDGDNNPALEEVIREAVDEEIRKIGNGQPIEETKRKRDEIKKRYSGCFTARVDSNSYIIDNLNDFYFEVDQAEETPLIGTDTAVEFARTPGVAIEKDLANEVVANLGTEPNRGNRGAIWKR